VVATGSHRKDLGAYYTDRKVARFLAKWAVRSPDDVILDPCFGGGVFLEEAARALGRFGALGSGHLTGVEIERTAYLRMKAVLEASDLSVQCRLLEGTCVIGNPPFVRYQRFKGEARERALSLCRSLGGYVTGLSSSWAPFIIAAAGCLRPGGRFGMVVPAEIGHATYAMAVVDFFGRSFKKVFLLTFRESLFANLNQDTMLLLAESKRYETTSEVSAELRWVDLANGHSLDGVPPDLAGMGEPVDVQRVLRGTTRFAEHYLPRPVRQLYGRLVTAPGVLRLGDAVTVGIGYVTGDNSFFHLDRERMATYSLPESVTKRVVLRSAWLKGVTYTDRDWQQAWRQGEPARLLHITDGLFQNASGVQEYLRKGEQQGVHRRYKCRVRLPWYYVPQVITPDGFLTYMAGTAPRLVVNEARVSAPNTLHVVRRRPGSPALGVLAAGFMSSLSQLSAELEGHSMGGGLLKVEPREANMVVVPTHGNLTQDTFRLMDTLLRAGDVSTAQDLADRVFLMEGLGLSDDACQALRAGVQMLRTRRQKGRTGVGAS